MSIGSCNAAVPKILISFGSTSKPLGDILVFFTIYTSSGLVAGATLFASSFDLEYSAALIIGLLVIVAVTLDQWIRRVSV